ncbi:MAG: hypothetical protein V3U65_16415 [Granulosicoccaceae bacterium]
MSRHVIPIEPLYSMLTEAPISVLQAMLTDLNDYTDDAELNDTYQSIELSRRVMLEQVNLVLDSRRGEQLTIF